MPHARVTYPPLVSSGPDDRGAGVVVTTYSLMFISIAFAALRAYSAMNRKRELGWDDAAFLLATLLIIPESVLTERAVGQGLGRHIDVLTQAAVTEYSKLLYVSHILGIIIQVLAKLTVISLMVRIGSQVLSKKAVAAAVAGVAAWGLLAVFGIAFQCGLPHPWLFSSDRCVVGGKLLYLFISGNIVTDAVLAFFFIPVIMKLQINSALQILLACLFGVRVIVCFASIAQVTAITYFLDSTDKTWTNALPEIFHQLVISLSVITAGIPSVQSSIADLKTGQMGARLNDQQFEMGSSARTPKGTRNGTLQSRTANNMNASHNSSRTQASSRTVVNQAPAAHVDPCPPSSRSSNSEHLLMRPDEVAKLSTHVVAGRASQPGAPSIKGKGNTFLVETRAEDELSDDNSTSSLQKNRVYRNVDVDVQVEYQNDRGGPRGHGPGIAR